MFLHRAILHVYAHLMWIMPESSKKRNSHGRDPKGKLCAAGGDLCRVTALASFQKMPTLSNILFFTGLLAY